MIPYQLTKLCDEIEALLKEATPFAYIYHFASPFGSEHLSLSSDEWNGHKPIRTTPVYADAAFRNAAQPLIDAARESMRLKDNERSNWDEIDRLKVLLRDETNEFKRYVLEEPLRYKRLTDAHERACSDALVILNENKRLNAELKRLNDWADGFSDAQLKERATGEAYQKELRAELDKVRKERDEASVFILRPD